MNEPEENQTQRGNSRRRLLFVLLLILTFGFGTVMVTQFTNFIPSKIVTTPPKSTNHQSTSSSKPIEKQEDEEQSSSQAPAASAKSSTSSSQVATPNVTNSQALVGKTLPEAIAWAQQNHRSYAWRANGQASDQNVVLSVQDDGTNLNLIVGPKS